MTARDTEFPPSMALTENETDLSALLRVDFCFYVVTRGHSPDWSERNISIYLVWAKWHVTDFSLFFFLV